MSCCCCCFPSIPESSRTIDEHVPLSHNSHSPPSSAVSSEAENRNLVPNIYTAPLQPPVPLAFSPRNLQSPSKLPRTQSNSGEGAQGITHAVLEKETWPVGDLTDTDLKKKDRETIDECPICLEEYESENPKLLTKCGHDFHLACILEWMERSEACPVCDKELVLNQ
ncbi:E3 ubiquitin-protein ligase ATL6 [Eutrema salsugineum]|uniref:E3 ubiquitin-protein ligase ATL6 n=1 Tax=Eutrema salsugineum TaxID=72664 RepID=UPI000CED611D|nr:E3 ubiquitin-protein ligase ATL6 [Eutrema salsugineum]